MTFESSVDAPLPWQQTAWDRFIRAVVSGRAPHAILLAGSVGIGKMRLAQAMAARLLCEQPTPTGACGDCRGCHLRQAGSHPDQLTVVPDAEGSGILKIDAVRALTEFAQRTSQFDGHRTAILAPAEALNRNAANALLKTLEEPPAGVVLILVSHRPARLPATIRSRCQLYRLGIPDRHSGLEWLQGQGIDDATVLLDLAGGAPLAAMALAESDGASRYRALTEQVAGVMTGKLSPVEAAADWQTVGAREVTRLMQRLALDIARQHALAEDSAGSGPDKIPAQATLAQQLPRRAVHRLSSRLGDLRQAAEQTLSRELSLEALFLLWKNSAENQR